MATGDQNDIVGRLRAVLPSGWFPQPTYDPGAYLETESGAILETEDGQSILSIAPSTATATPVLDGILNGLARSWAWVYSLIQYTITQARIKTATGVFLDGVAADFFGTSLQRLPGEGDSSLRARILATLLQPKATRAALIAALTSLTGRVPWVFEPRLPSDTGGYNLGGVGYGVAGGYGNLQLPFQAFVVAYRPTGGGVANVGGYWLGSGWAGGAYGMGALEYASLSMVEGAITDQMIYAQIASVIPAATIAWTRISN